MKEVFIRWLSPRARFKVFMLMSDNGHGPEYWMARSSREAAQASGNSHWKFIELSEFSMRCLMFECYDGSRITFEKRFQMLEKRPQLFAMEE